MDNGISKFTFDKLKERASRANKLDIVREIYEARSELVLWDSSNELKRYVSELEHGQSVIFWHIAMEICYNADINVDKNEEYVKFSKIFSDYMMYLLVKQPDMMSAVVGIFHKRYRATCGKLKHLDKKVGVETLEEFCSNVAEECSDGLLEPGNNDRDVQAHPR